MSQSRVLELLEKNPKGLTAKQIVEKLKLGKSTVQSNLTKMLKYNEIIRLSTPNKHKNTFVYKLK